MCARRVEIGQFQSVRGVSIYPISTTHAATAAYVPSPLLHTLYVRRVKSIITSNNFFSTFTTKVALKLFLDSSRLFTTYTTKFPSIFLESKGARFQHPLIPSDAVCEITVFLQLFKNGNFVFLQMDSRVHYYLLCIEGGDYGERLCNIHKRGGKI